MQPIGHLWIKEKRPERQLGRMEADDGVDKVPNWVRNRIIKLFKFNHYFYGELVVGETHFPLTMMFNTFKKEGSRDPDILCFPSTRRG